MKFSFLKVVSEIISLYSVKTLVNAFAILFFIDDYFLIFYKISPVENNDLILTNIASFAFIAKALFILAALMFIRFLLSFGLSFTLFNDILEDFTTTRNFVIACFLLAVALAINWELSKEHSTLLNFLIQPVWLKDAIASLVIFITGFIGLSYPKIQETK